MSILYAPQTTPALAAMTAARKEREKRFGAPPRYNIVAEASASAIPPRVAIVELAKIARPLYRIDRRYERVWMIALCGSDALLDTGVSIRAIQDAVCDEFDISFQNLISSRRTAAIVLPRHISIYQANVSTPRSYPQIGRQHGGLIIHPRSTRCSVLSARSRPIKTWPPASLQSGTLMASKRPSTRYSPACASCRWRSASRNCRRSLRLSVRAPVRRNEMNSYLRGQMDKLLRQEVRQERRAS